MKTDARPPAGKTRSVARRAVLALSVGLFATVLLPISAFAEEPRSWQNAPHVSGLQFLVVLVLIPAGLFTIISVLASLPYMIGNKGYEPGQSWRSEPEWFGGPRKGVEAAEEIPAKQIEASDSQTGGTSGTW